MRIGAKGATLIEAIVTMLVVVILAAVSSGVIVSLAGMFVYIPRDMTLRTVGQEIVEAMVEGVPSKSGMRYAAEVKDASGAQFSYTFGYPGNSDKRNMRFALSNGRIYRYYTGYGDPVTGPGEPYGHGEAIPDYITPDVVITGPGAALSTVFTYFKADGSEWVSGTDALNTIRRIDISIAVTSGNSVYNTTSSVDIKQYI
jgi:hypothetical protein